MSSKQGEKRASPRKYLAYPAQLNLGDGQPPHRCSLSDISATGARIVVSGAVTLPAEVTLMLSRDGVSRRCRVAWQNEAEAGLEFILPVSEPATPVRGRPGSSNALS